MVHKSYPQSEGGEVADVRTSEGEGLSQLGHFSDKGKGVNFSQFCADVFFERPRITLNNRK